MHTDRASYVDFVGIGLREALTKSQGRIAEQVVNAQKLRKRSCLRISRLAGEHRIPQTLVAPVDDLFEKRLMESVRGGIETESARRKGGGDSLPFRFQKLLRQRVEVREVEIAIQTVHGQKNWLL